PRPRSGGPSPCENCGFALRAPLIFAAIIGFDIRAMKSIKARGIAAPMKKADPFAAPDRNTCSRSRILRSLANIEASERAVLRSRIERMPPPCRHGGGLDHLTTPFDNAREVVVSEPQEQVAVLLHEAAETHHRVYRITDGVDADWASWYADWLIRLSEFPKLLEAAPVRSELVYMLVKLDKDFTRDAPGGRWEDYYAGELITHFKRV